MLRQTPVWAQSLAALLISLGALATAGAFLFKIDEVVTVTGQLESVGGTIEVKTPAGGRVAEVLFKDGDLVKKGQPLVRFDTRQAADSKATYLRLISLEQKDLDSKLLTVKAQQSMLDGRVDVLNKKLSTKTTIANEIGKLVEQGGFQRLQYLEQLDQVYELRKQLSEIEGQKTQLRLSAIQYSLEAKKNINQMRKNLKDAELQLQYKNVSAPVTGIVFDPQASVEGVIQGGERILSLVPQGSLYAEVFVPNQDVGFVKSGLKAKVRVDAFPFTRYGELIGEVSQIGADSLAPDSRKNFYRFPVKLDLSTSFLESKGIKIPLQSGMAITANLKLREKRVISLLSDMFVDQTDSLKSLRQQ
nr:HlyD family efflux transporter periplasmic adaptor subunit [Synechococcus sp. AH-779-G23]